MRSLRLIRLTALARFWMSVVAVLCLVCSTLLAGVATVNDLYSATVRVADRSPSARDQAVADALAVVLTKLSGQRALALRVATAQADVPRLVQRVGYASGGQLEVGFDPERINSLLDQSGMPLWDRIRPNVLIVLPSALQAAPEVQAKTELAARDRGLPILWAATETSDGVAVKDLKQIQALGAQYGVGVVLLARISGATESPGSVGANLRWQLVFGGNNQEWNGAPEEGPALAAEQLGRFYAVSGQQTSQHTIEVSGVDGLLTYGRITNYLTSFLTVKRVAVQALQGDVLRLQLEVCGTQTTLRRLLAVDKQLIEIESAETEAADMLRYRYNP